MKKMLATLLFMPVIAFSQPNEEVNLSTYCTSLNELEGVMAEFGELPALRGKTQRDIDGVPVENVLVIFMNPETKTWTIVERMSNGSFCVLSAGGALEAVPKDIVDNIIKNRQRKRS
jgi:hypothetical protein